MYSKYACFATDIFFETFQSRTFPSNTTRLLIGLMPSLSQPLRGRYTKRACLDKRHVKRSLDKVIANNTAK